MKPRDLLPRVVGAAAFAAAIAIGVDDRAGAGVKLLGFVLAVGGLVLIVQGRRVAAAWRIERHRRGPLAETIARRPRRAGGER